jgi:glycogen operon protein
VHRFVTLLNARRLFRDVEHERQRMSLNQMLRQAKTAWHGVKLNQPDWSPSSRSVAFTAEISKEKLLIHLILNAYWEALDFELPPISKVGGNPWRRWIDTALDSPNDIVEWQTSASITGIGYRAEPRSVVVLFAGME